MMSVQAQMYPMDHIPYGNGSLPGPYPQTSQTGFAFKKRFERIDWKKIASADVDAISRNMDFNALQENIMNVTFCNIENELDVRMIDPNFIKLFKLAQLTIEYLLHSQDYLSTMVTSLEDKLRASLQEHEETKKSLDKAKMELSEIKKESHKRKKMLTAQQHILQAGANAYNKCPYCSKAFINATFLQSHLSRRHTEYVSQYNQLVTSQPPLQQSQVQEVFTQSAPVNTQQAAPPHDKMSASDRQRPTSPDPEVERRRKAELELIESRLAMAESQLTEERNAKNRYLQEKEGFEEAEEQHQAELDTLKQQLEKQNADMEHMKDMFMKELKEMNEKHQAERESFAQMQKRKQSNLGVLQDDVENEKALLQQQREEVAMLKEQLQQQVEDSQKNPSARRGKKPVVAKPIEPDSTVDEDEVQQLAADFSRSIEELEQEEEEEEERELQAQYSEKLQEIHDSERLDEVQDYESDDEDEEGEMLDEVPFDSYKNDKIPPPVTPRQSLEKDALQEQSAKRVERPMEPPSDDETTEDMTSTVHTTTRGATLRDSKGATLHDSKGNTLRDSILGTTGSLSLSGTRNMKLIEQLAKNPAILQGLKKELRAVLDNHCEKRGIPKDCTGLTTPEFNNKMSMLKNERQQTAKKYKNFLDIRQQYLNEVEQLAHKQYRAYQAEQNLLKPPAYSPKMTPKNQRLAQSLPPQPSRSPSLQGHRPVSEGQGHPSPQRSPIHQPQSRAQQAPVPRPAPRAGSPPGKMLGTMSTMSSTQQSGSFTGTYTSTEFTETQASSSRWDSGEETEEEEEDSPPPTRGAPAPSNQRLGAPAPSNQRSGAPSNQRTQAAPQPKSAGVFSSAREEAARNVAREEEDDDDEEDDWDDISDLDDIVDPATPRASTMPARVTSSSPAPRGEKVAALSRTIEYQLSGRGKKPVGGVDTMESKKKNGDFEDFDESFPSVTDEEEDENEASHEVPKPRTRGAVRGSVQDTYSSNTYGTSAWGGSSKGTAPTASSTQKSKSSTMGVSDWDSDDDISNI